MRPRIALTVGAFCQSLRQGSVKRNMNETVLPAIRNYRPGDEAAWLRLLQAAPDFDYLFFNQPASLDALRMVIEHPHMDAANNLFYAHSGNDFVGYAEVWCAIGHIRAVGRVLVHPRWRRRGLGRQLMGCIEHRAAAAGSEYLDVSIAAPQVVGRHFLEHHGYHVVHYGWHMALQAQIAAPPPRWPQGYDSRRFVPGQDEGIVVQLENACFHDHWEYRPVELGEIDGFVRSASFRPEGIIVALSANKVVGECWTRISSQQLAAESLEQRGDIVTLCVLPQHRGRGLGRALLLAGVRWLRQQGAACIYLGVDGANDRAKHLYESVGFVTQRTDVWYRQELNA
jgi:mycothiol synthase